MSSWSTFIEFSKDYYYLLVFMCVDIHLLTMFYIFYTIDRLLMYVTNQLKYNQCLKCHLTKSVYNYIYWIWIWLGWYRLVPLSDPLLSPTEQILSMTYSLFAFYIDEICSDNTLTFIYSCYINFVACTVVQCCDNFLQY